MYSPLQLRIEALVLWFGFLVLGSASCHSDSGKNESAQAEQIEYPQLEPDIKERVGLEVSPKVPKESFFGLGLEVSSFSEAFRSLVLLYAAGKDGKSGAGLLSPEFKGYFQVNLDRAWKVKPGDATTAVAQSRWIFMSATAAELLKGPAEQKSFGEATRKGVQTLLEKFKDTSFGGYYHQVRADGRVLNNEKQDFSNCQVLLAFASAYKITAEPMLLQEGLQQVQLMLTKFADPKVRGGILPGLNREFGRAGNGRYRTGECTTHLFEGMLALYEQAGDKDKEWLAVEIQKLGDFISKTAVRPLEASSQHRYFSFYFDENWKPSSISLQTHNMYAGSGWVSVGHTFEMAFLLSRAVEMGFDSSWLRVAEDLLRFGIDFGMYQQRGGVVFLLDYTGRMIPKERNPMAEKLDWWPQFEAARALLHFAVVRGDRKALALFKRQERFIKQAFWDPQEGGWFGQVQDSGNGLYPALKLDKGDLWQDAYHQTMYFAEALRLARLFP